MKNSHLCNKIHNNTQNIMKCFIKQNKLVGTWKINVNTVKIIKSNRKRKSMIKSKEKIKKITLIIEY